MKVGRYIQTVWLAALLMGWGCLFTDCTDHMETLEPERPDVQTDKPLYVASMTRAGGDEEGDDPMKDKTIQLFLIQGNDKQSAPVLYGGRNVAVASGDMATGSLLVRPGTDYQVFGYIPVSVATGNTTVSGNTATMTINGLPPVSSEDICIVTGVLGRSLNDDGSLDESEIITVGNFDYSAPNDTKDGYGISLLVDHLFASVQVRILVDAGYSQLRRIKLKSVTLKTGKSKKVNATIPLTTDNPGANPIGSPIFVDADADADDQKVFLFESKTKEGNTIIGDPLDTTTPIVGTAYFAPYAATTLTIESTYDVYDSTGTHRIREGETAVNSLSNLFAGITRGQKRVLTMTVNPTYLYQLSDWDSPSFVVSED
ncbi:MAG: hypothetical protein IJ067_06195 [Prevotella sp.]|nr:hypothetical protein [Prevotella sp.]